MSVSVVMTMPVIVSMVVSVTVAMPVTSTRLLDGAPDPLGGQGHFQAGNAQGPQGVNDGVVDGHGRGDGAGLADALDPQRVVGRRRYRGKGSMSGTRWARGRA